MPVAPSMTDDRRVARAWVALPRLLRFFVVGGVNTLFGYGAYAALLALGFHYAAAAFLGTILGVLFNYLTTGRLVFEGATSRSLARFAGVYALLYLVNVALLALLQAILIGGGLVEPAVGPYLAGLILIVPMALLSFALLRRFVFRRSDRAGH